MYSTKKRHYFPSLFTLLSDRVSLAKYCFQKSFSFWRQMRLFLLLLSLKVRSNFLNRLARSIVSSAFPFGLSKHQMSPFQYIEEKTMHFETRLRKKNSFNFLDQTNKSYFFVESISIKLTIFVKWFTNYSVEIAEIYSHSNLAKISWK